MSTQSRSIKRPQLAHYYFLIALITCCYLSLQGTHNQDVVAISCFLPAEERQQYAFEWLVFSFCYLPPSRVPDKKIDPILSTVRAVTRKRRAELTHC